jgi:hypothetical protein
MQTPSSQRTPKRSLDTPESMGGNSPEDESTARVLFADETPTKKTRAVDPSSEDDIPGTPPSSGSFSLNGLLHSGRGEVPGIPSGPPPPQPRKPQKMRPYSEIYKWLPLLKLMFMSFCSRLLGEGDFGTVHEFHLPNLPGTPPSPPIAVKEIKFDTPGVCSTDLQDEVKRLGSPGCVPGVACRTDDSARIFMPLGVSLDKLHYSKMAPDTLEWLIKVIHWICKTVESGVVADLKPANLIFLPAGTATVVKDAEGQPCMGPPTEFDDIVVCDLGTVDPTSGGTKKYGVLPLESDAAQPGVEARLRQFKATMLEALIRDAANPSGKTIEQIVAGCVPEGWAYAAGEQHQAQAQQLRF